jgi:DNA invertase Pin-like site-specific DNA recombinase
VYCRISRDRVGAGLGVERQEADCRELADRLGWTVAVVHTDNDISAYSGKPRPGYRALLADIEAGRVDAVLAWHTDRLHRSPAELEIYISACETNGVPTNFVKAGDLDLSHASGRMNARITGAVARHEVEHMVERQKAAKDQAAKAGKYRGGARPFGYEADGVTVRPEEAALVVDASRRVLHGESLSCLAREWTARGIESAAWHPPLVPTTWTPVALRRVLLRARNAALIEADGKELPATWPRIVAEDTWRAVRVLCADPTRRAAKSNDAVWLGSGLYLCGVCGDGTAMRAGITSSGQPGYRCKRSAHLAVKAAPVDDLITSLVLARLSRPDARLLLHTEHGSDTEALADEAAALRVTNAGLVALFAEGVITAGELRAERARIQAKLAELASRMANAAAGSPLAGFADAEDIAAAWADASVSRRKVVVNALMTVTLHSPGRGARAFDPAAVGITWRS